MRKNYLLALEGDTVDTLGASTPLPIPADELLQLQQSSQEVEAEAADIQSLITAVETTIEAVEDLDGVVSVMAGSVEEGEGLSPIAAEIAEVAVESICTKLGVVYGGKLSQESFNGKVTRIEATKLALEETRNIAVRVWEVIKKAIKKIFDKIVDFLSNLFGNLAMQRSSVKKLQDIVSSKEFKDVKNTKPGILEDGDGRKQQQLSHAFSFVKGGTHNPFGILKNHIDTTDNFPAFLNRIKTNKKLLEEGFAKIATEESRDLVVARPEVISNSKEELEDISEKFANNEKEALDELFKGVMGDYHKKHLHSFGPFIHGKSFTYWRKNDEDIDRTSHGYLSSKLVFSVVDFELGTLIYVTNIKSLPYSSISDFLKLIEKLIDSTEVFQKEQSKIKAYGNEMMDVVNRITADVKEMFNKENVSGSATVRQQFSYFVKDSVTLANKVIITLPSLNIQAIRAGLIYAKESIDFYLDTDRSNL